jgi:hypothetical protein
LIYGFGIDYSFMESNNWFVVALFM